MNQQINRIYLYNQLRDFVLDKTVDVLGEVEHKDILTDMLLCSGAKKINFYYVSPKSLCSEVCLCSSEFIGLMGNVSDYSQICEIYMDDTVYNEFSAWRKGESAFEEFMTELAKIRVAPDDNAKEIGVLVSTCHWISIPWYMVSLAFLFSSCSKFKVTILFADDLIGYNHQFGQLELDSVANMVKKAEKYLKVVRYSDYQDSSGHVQIPDFIDYMSEYARMHDYYGETAEDYLGLEALYKKQFTRHWIILNNLLKKNGFDHLMVFGGVAWAPGMLYKTAKHFCVPCSTFEYAANSFVFSNIGPAINFLDTPQVAKDILLTDKDFAVEKAKQQLSHYQKKGSFYYELEKKDMIWRGEKGFILLLPNIIWDTSVLGMHEAFSGSVEWIEKSVKWVIENTDKTIIVRRHPFEAVIQSFQKGSDNIEALVDKYKHTGRAIYFEAAHPINTYSLIENSDVVLLATGTAGMEAAAIGKPVINSCNVYYSAGKFTWTANTQNEYFDFLRQAINGELVVTKEQMEMAYVYYYCALSLRPPTSFTRLGAARWEKSSPDDFVRDHKIIIESVLTGVPVYTLVHQQRKGIQKAT